MSAASIFWQPVTQAVRVISTPMKIADMETAYQQEHIVIHVHKINKGRI